MPWHCAIQTSTPGIQYVKITTSTAITVTQDGAAPVVTAPATVSVRALDLLTFQVTASDADVIKTYVRLGLGVGIVASMSLDPQADADLVQIDAAHLFEPHITWIGFRRGRLLRGYMYEFLKSFAPHLNRRLVDQAIRAGEGPELEALFDDVDLPLR